MKYLKHLTTAIFLSIFCVAIFSAMKPKEVENNYPQISDNLVFDKKFSGKVKVIDGDSIRVGDKEVRLFGIDAPEFKQTCFNAKNEEYECGRASFEFLNNFADNKNAECYYAQKDRYNRYLSKCFVNNISINEEILRNGMAIIYNFTQSDDTMKKLEAEAKERKLGIWQGAFQLPKQYRKKHPHK